MVSQERKKVDVGPARTKDVVIYSKFVDAREKESIKMAKRL